MEGSHEVVASKEGERVHEKREDGRKEEREERRRRKRQEEESQKKKSAWPGKDPRGKKQHLSFCV